jgi:SAM-dependent methyltransferase
MSASQSEYVLGTGESEIARLAVQHSVWRDDALAVWQLARFAPGERILDLGCGPGFAALDLAEVLGEGGRVIAVDQSETFLAHLRMEADRRELSERIEAIQSDATHLKLQESSLDGVWMRWVLAFVRDPVAVLRTAVRAMKPGAAIVLHEYYDYRMWRFFPVDPEFEGFVERIIKSWRRRSGEPDVGFGLPVVLSDLGLTVTDVKVIAHVVEPGTPRWRWATGFADSAVPLLRTLGDVTAEEAARLDTVVARTIREAKLMATPGVLEVIARKPAAQG